MPIFRQQALIQLPGTSMHIMDNTQCGAVSVLKHWARWKSSPNHASEEAISLTTLYSSLNFASAAVAVDSSHIIAYTVRTKKTII